MCVSLACWFSQVFTLLLDVNSQRYVKARRDEKDKEETDSEAAVLHCSTFVDARLGRAPKRYTSHHLVRVFVEGTAQLFPSAGRRDSRDLLVCAITRHEEHQEKKIGSTAGAERARGAQ